MRILQVNTVAGIGSTGRIACDIAELVNSGGGDCRVAYGIEPCPEKYKDIAFRIGNDFSVKLHSAASQLFDAEGLGSRRASHQLIEYLEKYKPDILHLHNIHGCFLNYPILFDYLKKSQLPIVWTLHDCWAFTGHCAYFDYVDCEKWKRQCEQCPQSKEGYPRNLFFDFSRRNYKLKKRYFDGLNLNIVTPSLWLKNLVKNSILKDYPCTVVYNGVDLNSFYPDKSIPKKFAFDGKKLLLAVAGDWDRRKGIYDMMHIADKLPDTHIIVAIGNGAPKHERIIALPRTESLGELRQLYNRADCVINPTYEDNFPMVNLEALACGTPVVVYDTGGCPEAIDESVGAVVTKGDFNMLLQKAINISKEDYTNNCLRLAQKFEKFSCFNGYIKLYNEIIDEVKK